MAMVLLKVTMVEMDSWTSDARVLPVTWPFFLFQIPIDRLNITKAAIMLHSIRPSDDGSLILVVNSLFRKWLYLLYLLSITYWDRYHYCTFEVKEKGKLKLVTNPRLLLCVCARAQANMTFWVERVDIHRLKAKTTWLRTNRDMSDRPHWNTISA